MVVTGRGVFQGCNTTGCNGSWCVPGPSATTCLCSTTGFWCRDPALRSESSSASNHPVSIASVELSCQYHVSDHPVTIASIGLSHQYHMCQTTQSVSDYPVSIMCVRPPDQCRTILSVLYVSDHPVSLACVGLSCQYHMCQTT